ncbi:protein CHROMATIN REMODELING 20 isoform X1 [Selaginella moellendorffii]|uniref:protein CHROMATIN REMODELING 20 isoform X1 n=1 Tax=Selaginella moellendorffii TaxID=88036 RepID=UPI000D1CCBC7|nr:protein CHROMATIN REMODELING 20 isoform X1 [Selaginella moellendorffii]|eukprot:XP_024539294.1 protein CHROMATIN REMODELING 20 isoform X1 [Selaginella moellendorffii]
MGDPELQVKFNAGLAAARRVAALIVGQPFCASDCIKAENPLDDVKISLRSVREVPSIGERSENGLLVEEQGKVCEEDECQEEKVSPQAQVKEEIRCEEQVDGNSCEIIRVDADEEKSCELVEKEDKACEVQRREEGDGGVEKDSSEDECDGDGYMSESSSEGSKSDEEVTRMIDWLVEIESESADAQEHLEDESVKKVEEEVRLELSETLSGQELDMAVSCEMADYVSIWKKTLLELEEESAKLQDRLEDAGVSLPDLFKAIEKQAAEGCMTDTWRNRAHWAGTQAPEDFAEVLHSAEKDLDALRPVIRRRGKLVEEGASGFLERKVNDVDTVKGSTGWEAFDSAFQPKLSAVSLFESKKWAAVYSASTPEQAARLGLKFPGVDKVDDIADIDQHVGMEAAALAEESEFGLTEHQKKTMKRVREEDDVRQMQKKIGARRVNCGFGGAMASQVKSSTSDVNIITEPPAVLSRLQPDTIDLGTAGDPQNTDELRLEDEQRQSHERQTGTDQAIADNVTTRNQSFINGTPSRSEEKVKKGVAPAREGKDHIRNASSFGRPTTDGTEPMPVFMEQTVRDNETQAEAVADGSQCHDEAVETEEFKVLKRSNSFKAIGVRTSSAGDDAKKPTPSMVIVVSDDDDDDPPADCGSTAQPRTVDQGKVPSKDVTALDETTSPLKPLKRVTEHGSSSRCKRKRCFMVNSSEDEEDATSAKKEQSGLKSDRDEQEERNSDSCDLSQSKLSGDTRRRLTRGNRSFGCTVCGETMSAKDVLSHPVLKVIICTSCKQQYDDGPFRKDEDGSEAECRWCGEGGSLICCDSCDKVFCESCIGRNFGPAFLESIEDISWKCYLCDPSPLASLQQWLKVAEEEALKESLANLDVRRNRKKQRKNIRRVLRDDELDEVTKQKLALEKERRERLAEWYAEARKGKSLSGKAANSEKAVEGTDGDDHICEGDCKTEGCVINIASRQTGEPLVRIPASISKHLKPHQLCGVRFMWDNCIESVEKVKSGDVGLGCILAHSMGLGKTLQVIAFLYTVMRNVDLNFKTVLVVVPVNVLHNWKREFEKWRPAEVAPLEVSMLDTSRDNATRASLLKSWKEKGGVMLIGYAAFRNLSTGSHVKDKETRDTLCKCLQDPGADIVVCDEGHTIKNDKADITIALQRVKSGRRIAMTGSPLQNNLMEYYCMVDFVRPGFLGPQAIFRNKVQNPIANGQHADSTPDDVKKMKRTVHILHKRLSGFVQRRDMTVLKDELPPKCVWVISVRLSPLQKQLYKKFLSLCETGRSKLFDHYHVLAKIWNHPDLLAIAKEQRLNEEFIVDSEKEDSAENGQGCPKRASPEADSFEWCEEILKESKRDVLENSGKMVLIMTLLSLNSSRGEKTLVFSQSLHTLDLIENFLDTIPLGGSQDVWNKGREWLRLDGNTTASRRQQIADIFNDPNNTAIKCLLISTKAGSLGTNMTGANRVIIVDGSWNPTHDLQALFRAWRYGQTKPVFVYRLLAYGTMEEKIYNRQLTKEGIAARVLDAHQVGRHLNADDLELMYTLDDDDDEEGTQLAGTEQQQQPGAKGQKPKHKTFFVPSDAPPRDDHMAMLLLDFRPQWIAQYHEHEPLLEDLEEEKLTPEEMKTAWDGYIIEHELQNRQIPSQSPTNYPPQSQYPASSTDVRPPFTATPSKAACNDVYHASLLESLSIPVGGSVACGKCLQRVRWENLGIPDFNKQQQQQQQQQQ